MSLDAVALRRAFPLLTQSLARQPVLWLDCASTTPRLQAAIDATREFQERYTANVHRGVHPFAAEASAAYEAARHEVATHFGAQPSEVVFTRGTTESINMVALGLDLQPDDEVVSTLAEHHANHLPWRVRASLRCVPARADGTPEWSALPELIGPRTRLIAVHHVSNVLGTFAPLEAIATLARRHGIPMLVDGAQSAGHVPVDVEALGCDFFAFSGHKLGAPGGTGALIARGDWLDRLTPTNYGGAMVAQVDLRAIELREGPARFEAGTPNVDGVLGLAAALRFLRGLGMAEIEAHGRQLAALLVEGCASLPGVRLLGDRSAARIPLVSLALPAQGLDAETLARTLADTSGILLSAGRHCAHPLHGLAGAGATLRASAWLFNDAADVARLFDALRPLMS